MTTVETSYSLSPLSPLRARGPGFLYIKYVSVVPQTHIFFFLPPAGVIVTKLSHRNLIAPSMGVKMNSMIQTFYIDRDRQFLELLGGACGELVNLFFMPCNAAMTFLKIKG